MLRKTILTFSGKLFIAGINFLTVIITSQFLGAEGRGIISLFILNLTLISMVSNFIGGPGLVYLFPRNNSSALLSASYLWAAISCIVVSFVLRIFSLIEINLFFHLILLSFLQCIAGIHLQLLLSKQKIRQYNILSIIYPATTLLSLFYFFSFQNEKTIDYYFISLYIGFILSAAVSIFFVFKHISFSFFTGLSEVYKQAFRLGFIIQCANIIQLFNYRLSFYLIDHFHGKQSVGIYSTAVSIAEAVWIIANSFAIIQYSQIANSEDDEKNKNLTVQFSKIVLLLTFVAVLILLILPGDFFVWIFGNDFGTLTTIFPLFAPGILFLIFSIMISHYYSGSGNPNIGLAGSAAGLAVTLIAGFLLIPEYNIKGAALTASLSYISSALLLLVIFMKQKKLRVKDFIPDLKSFQFLKQKER